MKRFIFGLLGFVVVWIVGLAPQFLVYGHVSAIVIFGLEGGVSVAGYLLYVRVVEKRSALELSHFRIILLPLGILVGIVWFGLLVAMLYAGGHYEINRLAFPNRLLSAVIFSDWDGNLGGGDFSRITLSSHRANFRHLGWCCRFGGCVWCASRIEPERVAGRVSRNHARIRDSFGRSLFCNAHLVAANRLAFWLEFCGRLHLCCAYIGARVAPCDRRGNPDRLSAMDWWRLWTGIFDFGDRNGSDLVRSPHHDRHSSTRNRAIHA